MRGAEPEAEAAAGGRCEWLDLEYTGRRPGPL
jgi:hypothetical protein